ncbi:MULTISPECIES: RHS repeat-associated core domain-containing protein [unclassified Streptomyces]|uniref:RHS repeat domain-containing protein n=1 Tax=unclassified Streptomyces TaxID=2593676 RepID=UPI002366C81E|nr:MULTISPECIES: RHS repeat-associated core domain-containing protein [unclassified Streptomyces]MDF3141828.1 RHS repeat-associated core domain-containing protein [Streptomyces sp. T21Q-yed]WDF41377.1 RHS repeat-associated core domain-containing protein [Streptomyces sp. T12]
MRTATSGTSGTKLSFLAADHHGTSSIALDSSTYAITKRYSTPFGATRGTKATAWPDDKAFLGKPADDSTGLTHVGAREYDPAMGQFISVDPLLEVDRHQTLNGYSYGAQSPITESDPTGMGLACGGEFPACPTHPDGTPGNGQPIETVDNTSGTAEVDSHGQTLTSGDGQVLACAYGHCIGNVDVHLNLGNNGDSWLYGPQPEWSFREAIRNLLEGPVCNPGYPCEDILVAVGPEGVGAGGRPGPKDANEPGAAVSKGRLQQLSGDAYEVSLMKRLGGKPGPDGKPGFKVGKRQFDGRYTPEGSAREVWYEAKSGKYWDRLSSDPDEMLRFKSKLGESRRIATENDADFRVISENPVPQNLQNYFLKKGFEWEVIPRG